MVDVARKSRRHDKLRFLITVSGVAFAVTLVFVQVGLFQGVLDNASITIEHLDADLWVTSHNTPNVDFAHTFPESYVDRVRSVPGVAAADNLIVWFMTAALPSGAQEGALVYALSDFARWKLPWHVAEGNLADLRRGRYLFLDDSAKKRFGAFHTGEYRERLDTRMKIIGRTQEPLSFTTTPIAFVDYRRAQSLSPDQLLGRTTYILIKLAPGADVEAVRRQVSPPLPHHHRHTPPGGALPSRPHWVGNPRPA